MRATRRPSSRCCSPWWPRHRVPRRPSPSRPPADAAPGLPAARPPLPGHADRRRLRRLRGRPVAVVRRARGGLRGGVAVPAAAARQLRDQHAARGRAPRRPRRSSPPRWTPAPGRRTRSRAPGKSADLGLSVLNDKLDIPPAGKASVRVINAALSVPSADVGPVNGPVWATDVAFGTETAYVDCPLGKWDLAVSSAGASATVPLTLRGELDLHRAADRQGQRAGAAGHPRQHRRGHGALRRRSRPGWAARPARTCCRPLSAGPRCWPARRAGRGAVPARPPVALTGRSRSAAGRPAGAGGPDCRRWPCRDRRARPRAAW